MKTILCGQFKQETNRYAPGVSDQKAYEAREYYWTEDAVRGCFTGSKTELGGFFDVLDPIKDCRLLPVLALNASPGPVTGQAVWQQVWEKLSKSIASTPSVDGILLALHGAMVTEEMEDGEGELLERIRAQVGPDVPIIATLDLHANITEKMVANATALFPCEYYPHTDFYETGMRAAETMWKAVTNKAAPVMRYHKLDMLFPFVITSNGPIVPLLIKIQELRDAGTLINAGICHGFFHSDIHELGAAVLAIADGNSEQAQQYADELAAEIWRNKEQFDRIFYTPKDAVGMALNATKGPVVLADVADNPGSGSTMDSVVLLKQLLDMGATNTVFAAICDPEVVNQAKAAGIGAEIEISLGSKQAPDITGDALRCKATVQNLTNGCFRNKGIMFHGVQVNFGDCAVLRIGDVQVIVCSNHAQPYDLEIYKHCGIDPTKQRILAVKSAVHFRADYERIAAQILDVETPALGCMRPQMLPLAHCRRPIYPLDRCKERSMEYKECELGVNKPYEVVMGEFLPNLADYYKDPSGYNVEPFRIFGNLYYVGDKKVCMHLIDTGDGLILFDSGFSHNYDALLNSIKLLGFSPADVKILIHSHGHFDHFGGGDRMRRDYGTKIYMSAIDTALIREMPERALMHLAPGKEDVICYPDITIENGDVISLGNTRIECVLSPGHTPGTTTFFFQAFDGEKSLDVGYFGGVGFLTLYKEYLEEYRIDPNMLEIFRNVIVKLKERQVDIFLGNHPYHNCTLEKRQYMLENPDINPFINRNGWQIFLDALESRRAEFVRLGY